MQKDQYEFPTQKQGFNLLYVLLLAHQRGIVIPMRRNFGYEALNKPCLMALGMMVLWTGLSQDPYMWIWVGCWLLCLMARRIETAKNARNNVRVHSQYDGWPQDAIRYGKTENNAKFYVEPIIIGLLGGILHWFYEQQGWPTYGLPRFLLFGCITLPAVEIIKQTIWKRRTQAVLDSQIEGQAVMDDFRQRYGDS